MTFVDTNYFLRYLFADVPDQCQKSRLLFRSASVGDKKLITDIIVMFEIYWVAKNAYGVKNPLTKQFLLQVCHMDYIFVENKSILFEAINNFESFNYDLEDAYHFYYVKSKGVNQIATFNKNLIKKFK